MHILARSALEATRHGVCVRVLVVPRSLQSFILSTVEGAT